MASPDNEVLRTNIRSWPVLQTKEKPVGAEVSCGQSSSHGSQAHTSRLHEHHRCTCGHNLNSRHFKRGRSYFSLEIILMEDETEMSYP